MTRFFLAASATSATPETRLQCSHRDEDDLSQTWRWFVTGFWSGQARSRRLPKRGGSDWCFGPARLLLSDFWQLPSSHTPSVHPERITLVCIVIWHHLLLITKMEPPIGWSFPGSGPEGLKICPCACRPTCASLPTRSEPTTAAYSKPQSAADETASVGVRHPADVDFEAICKASNLAIKTSQTVTLNPQFVHSHLL